MRELQIMAVLNSFNIIYGAGLITPFITELFYAMSNLYLKVKMMEKMIKMTIMMTTMNITMTNRVIDND